MAQIDDIKQVAFFGDSYCAATMAHWKHIDQRKPWYPPTASYMDIFAEKFNLEIVYSGAPSHGPQWMIHEFREWLKSKSQEEINSTHFVFLWSDPARTIIVDESGQHELRERPFNGATHHNEMCMPYPDAPMLNEKDLRGDYIFDQRVKQALQLWWLYLRSEPEFYRLFQTARDAWKYYIEQYNITSYQQYHCFDFIAEFEKNCFSFEHNGDYMLKKARPGHKGKPSYKPEEGYACLQNFAFDHDDYIQGENDEHYNHFSPKGQKSMADVLTEKFKEIHG